MNTILITGASSGIGKATALRFRAEGWNVIATMRDPAAGADLAALDKLLVTRLDVTDSAALRAATRRGSSMMILRPCSHGASSRANGTWVVLPAPGGASSTRRACAARWSRICGSSGEMGKREEFIG